MQEGACFISHLVVYLRVQLLPVDYRNEIKLDTQQLKKKIILKMSQKYLQPQDEADETEAKSHYLKPLGSIFSKKAIFTFGRFQPLHLGHSLLFDILLERSSEYTPFAFMSQRYDGDSNPLSYGHRSDIIQTVYPWVNVPNADHKDQFSDPFKALEYLCKAGFRDIIFVVGQDRFDAFQSMQNYKEKFGFDKLEIISAGWRECTAEDITGISATKVRNCALRKDFPEFYRWKPRGMTMASWYEIYQVLSERKVNNSI